MIAPVDDPGELPEFPEFQEILSNDSSRVYARDSIKNFPELFSLRDFFKVFSEISLDYILRFL